MKVKISGYKPVVEDVPEVVQEVEPIEEELVEDETIEDEEYVEEVDSEEESDADFQYNNTGIYFRNGIEIEFNVENEDISVSSIKFPNDIVFEFKCDEVGNLTEWKQVTEE